MASKQILEHDRIVSDPDILVGKPTIRGTRISVELIIEYLANNPNFDDLFVDYPDLTMADVQAALAFARDMIDGKRALPARRRRASGRVARQAV